MNGPSIWLVERYLFDIQLYMLVPKGSLNDFLEFLIPTKPQLLVECRFAKIKEKRRRGLQALSLSSLQVKAEIRGPTDKVMG